MNTRKRTCCCCKEFEKVFISVYPADGGARLAQLRLCRCDRCETVEAAIKQLVQRETLTGKFIATISQIGATPRMMHFTAEPVERPIEVTFV